jgi:hypothetical protein
VVVVVVVLVVPVAVADGDHSGHGHGHGHVYDHVYDLSRLAREYCGFLHVAVQDTLVL